MALTAAAAGLISAGIAAGASGVSSGIQAGRGKKGREQAQKMFDEQMSFAREQFDYQQYVAENGYQIAVADAEKAGLSPLAVTDGASAPSGVSQPTPSPEQFNYGLDLNSFVDSMRAQADAQLRYSEEQGRNARNKEDIEADWAKLNLQIDAAAKTLEDNQQFELAKLLKEQQFSEDLQSRREWHEFSQQQIKNLADATGGSFHKFERYTDEGEYNRAMERWLTAAIPLFEEYGSKVDMQSTSGSTSSAGGAGVNVGLGSAGPSVGVNGNGSHAESSSNFESRGDNNKADLGAKLNALNVPYPLYTPRRR